MHPPLLLFDIDGTLVRRAGPLHRQVLEEAAAAVTGVAATTANIPTQGMLDGQILTLMLREAGLSRAAIGRAMPAMMEMAQELYVARCPDLRKKVCPGARSVLHRLARKRVRTGLVTGNLSRIGWQKMESAGLRQYLHFGAFAEQGDERRKLVGQAVREARRAGWITRQSLVALVGDHENDILAAQANGIPVISVATGVSTAAELRKLNPDYLIEDLRSFPWQELSL
ncbi:MAG: HAD hydrolase-like protein [Acidobacteriaceae bacterium]|nr:HAD hydrolase-like protein [Acidobacteriaceae bacterium]